MSQGRKRRQKTFTDVRAEHGTCYIGPDGGGQDRAFSVSSELLNSSNVLAVRLGQGLCVALRWFSPNGPDPVLDPKFPKGVGDLA